MELNLWSGIFLFCAIQSIFLISIVWFHHRENMIATVFLSFVLFFTFVGNLDYLILSSGLYRYVPNLFGISNGLILLIGPCLYFYINSVLDEKYELKWTILFHGIPYLLNAIVHIPFIFMDTSKRLYFINQFLADKIPLNIFLVILFSLQLIHFGIYLWKSYKLILRVEMNRVPETYFTPFHHRLKWIKWLYGGLLCYGIFVLLFAIWCFATYSFNHVANYLYTLCLSVVTLILAYGIVLKTEWVLPGFTKRYSSQLINKKYKTQLRDKLSYIMENDKPYLDPDLKMEDLAIQMAISKNVLSQLVNQEFYQNFRAFLNSYRVREFIRLLDDPQSQHLSLFGIAQEAGFKSKSTFNTAFHHNTGMTPSEYKKTKSDNTSDFIK